MTISWENQKDPHHHIFKTHFRMPVKHEMISGIFRETSSTAITLNRESNCSRREESFSIPLKFFDFSRATRTTLDVMQESRIGDHWNVDGSRDLSDSWTGVTQYTLLKETPPDGYTWSGERFTKRQATSRPDHLWPEIWKDMSRNSELRKSKIGQSRNRSSTMPKDKQGFPSLTLRT